MQFHPLGHLLVSASNDYTTRFWCRERPTEVGGEWKAGGEKPSEAMGGEQQDEDEDYVPGLSFAGHGGIDGNFGGYRDDQQERPGGLPPNVNTLPGFARPDEDFIPGFGGAPPMMPPNEGPPLGQDIHFGTGSNRDFGNGWPEGGANRGNRGGRNKNSRWG